jgi:N-acetylglucosamine-6-sulfatase
MLRVTCAHRAGTRKGESLAMRNVLRLFLCLVVGVAAASVPPSAASSEAMAADGAAAASPNIIIVLTDDQPVRTMQLMGNVQAMRSAGVTFRRAIVSNPLCCPSRATILTGLYSHSTGVYTNGDDQDRRIGGYQSFAANGT